MNSVVIREGDVLMSGADIICHQVNCRGVMGAGLAKQVKQANPQLFRQYCERCKQYSGRPLGSAQLLGSALILPIDKDRYKEIASQHFIANCFGQDGFGRSGVHTNYDALKASLVRVREFAKFYGKKTIAIPYMLGCGLAGGNWDTVQKIIGEVFDWCLGLEVTIWRYVP